MASIQYISPRYIDGNRLRALLEDLFPGQWEAKVCSTVRGVLDLSRMTSTYKSALQLRLSKWIVTTPRSLTQVCQLVLPTLSEPRLAE
jgi:hypothetical protein